MNYAKYINYIKFLAGFMYQKTATCFFYGLAWAIAHHYIHQRLTVEGLLLLAAALGAIWMGVEIIWWHVRWLAYSLDALEKVKRILKRP